MGFFSGIRYNIRGTALALRTPSLLILGLLRFAVILVLTLVLSGAVLLYHEALLSAVWQAPEGGWLLYLWYGVSWLLTLVLVLVAMVLAYLLGQIFFGVFIMDYMSRLTERIVLGREQAAPHASWFAFFLYLMRQEIPRALVPVMLALLISVIGFFTPLGPVILVISSVAAAIFLAWDNTDLVPARRMVPFRQRFGFLKKNLLFHAGFGILFLIPWLNILFLSFAPVGATLYFLEREK